MAKPRKRRTLTVGGPVSAGKSKSLGKANSTHSVQRHSKKTKTPIVGTIDFLLPCRDFLVDFKVADTKRLSITLEYLLRLLKLLGRLSEEEVASFFGYSRHELEFVLTEARAHGYVVWRNSEIELSRSGRALFSPGENIPYSLDLQTYSKRVGFDLISFGLESREHLSAFERYLPELEIEDTSFVESGTQDVPDVFRHNYFEIMVSDSRLEKDRKDLYSIDKVVSSNRFSTVVSVDLRQDTENVGQPDFSISGPRGEQDPTDRDKIYEGISSFLSRQCRTSSPQDRVSIDVFNALIEAALESPLTKVFDHLPTAETVSQVLSSSIKRKEGNSTFFGSPFLPTTVAELVGSIRSGKLERECVSNVVWLLPNAPAWGMTKNLPVFLGAVFDELGSHIDDRRDVNDRRSAKNEEMRQGIHQLDWMYSGSLERHVEVAFKPYVDSGYELSMSNNLVEVLVCSDAAVLIAMHLPPARGSSLLAPVGLISSSKEVVSFAQQYLRKLRGFTRV